MIEYAWADVDVNGVDVRDHEIAQSRERAWEKAYHGEPRVGDFVTFADDVVRQVSHVWPADWHSDNEARFQTSDAGSFHFGGGRLGAFEQFVGELGNGETASPYMSFSGGLHPGVRRSTLRPMRGRRRGVVWFFHHDSPRAHSAVHWRLEMRRWRCSLSSKDRSGD